MDLVSLLNVSNGQNWKLPILFKLLENFNTWRDKRVTATVASKGRMGSYKPSIGKSESFSKSYWTICCIIHSYWFFLFFCFSSPNQSSYLTGRIWTNNLYTSKTSLWRMQCKRLVSLSLQGDLKLKPIF